MLRVDHGWSNWRVGHLRCECTFCLCLMALPSEGLPKVNPFSLFFMGLLLNSSMCTKLKLKELERNMNMPSILSLQRHVPHSPSGACPQASGKNNGSNSCAGTRCQDRIRMHQGHGGLCNEVQENTANPLFQQCFNKSNEYVESCLPLPNVVKYFAWKVCSKKAQHSFLFWQAGLHILYPHVEAGDCSSIGRF